MKRETLHRLIACFLTLYTLVCTPVLADEHYRLRMYFGLSLPAGGAVSLVQWQAFQDAEIATIFDGFNVVDSVGYYRGKPERSKLVTVVGTAEQLKEAKAIAARYASKFQQESVMVITTPVVEWEFIGPEQSSDNIQLGQ